MTVLVISLLLEDVFVEIMCKCCSSAECWRGMVDSSFKVGLVFLCSAGCVSDHWKHYILYITTHTYKGSLWLSFLCKNCENRQNWSKAVWCLMLNLSQPFQTCLLSVISEHSQHDGVWMSALGSNSIWCVNKWRLKNESCHIFTESQYQSTVQAYQLVPCLKDTENRIKPCLISFVSFNFSLQHLTFWGAFFFLLLKAVQFQVLYSDFEHVFVGKEFGSNVFFFFTLTIKDWYYKGYSCPPSG